MPYVKSIPVRTTVNKTLSYILDPDKTDQLIYTASMNCMTSARDAYLEMKCVFETFSTEKYNAPLPLEGKGSVKAIHYIQSFDPKDDITPELAHRIGKAFARKTFGDDCQVVIATHIDKGHVHNHLIVNTYTMTGRKFNDNQATLKHVREYSDRVCLAFGIQPFDKSKGKGKTVTYNEWENKKRGTSWKQKIQLEIDNIIGHVNSIDEMLYELILKGYEVKKGKYISLKEPGQSRFIRTKTLGEDYTTESLASRILWKDVGSNIALNNEKSTLSESYRMVIGQVIQLATENKKVRRRRDRTSPYSSQNDFDVHRLSAQLTIINHDRIHSIGELKGFIQSLKNDYEQTRQEVNSLLTKHDKLESLLQQAELYFDLSEKPELSDIEQLQLKVNRQSIENNDIYSRSDLERIKEELKKTDKQLNTQNEQLNNYRHKFNVYSDIVKTYHEISQGDYISRLVKEKQQEEERAKAAAKRGSR